MSTPGLRLPLFRNRVAGTTRDAAPAAKMSETYTLLQEVLQPALRTQRPCLATIEL